MKALLIENAYYLYPERVETFAELVEMVNRNPDVFIHFRGFANTDHFPYLLDEDMTETALKFRNIRSVREVDVCLMNRADYVRAFTAYCQNERKESAHGTGVDDLS